MEDVKMSEEDSINDTSDSDSSESIDEEIKLSQNFICVLQKISSDSKTYDDYILLLDIAHDLKDFDKIRQSIDLFSNEYPLSPEIWLRYLKAEMSVAQNHEEVDNVIKLFKRALTDYYSIDVALEYAALAATCNEDQAEEIWNDLLPAYGYEFTKGRLIWQLWRNYYIKCDSIDNQEKYRKIIKKFKEELLLPLNDMHLTYIEFRSFLEKHGHELQNAFDHKSFDDEVKDTKKILQKVSPFEKRLAALDSKAHNERVELFKSYISECADDLEEEFVQVLYERMITACCLNESVWRLYIDFIQNRSLEWKPLESNKSKIFLQTDFDIVERGLRNCNWSAELYIQKMRILEIRKESRETIQNVLETATQIQYNSPDPLVKIWIEYLSYLTRITNYNDEKEIEILRNNFNLGWNTLGWQFGNIADSDCEILKFWGRIEYSKLNDCNQGKQLWNTVMESNENFLKTGLWIEFAQLEQQYRGIEAARLILKRSVKNHDLNDISTMISYWSRFERCHGNVEHLNYCHDTCDKIWKQYLKKTNVQQKRKSLHFKQEQSQHNDKKRKKMTDDESEQVKNKRIKENLTVSKEEFQKLAITKQRSPHGNDTEEMTTADMAKDNVRIFLSNLQMNITVDDLREAFPELNFVNFKMITRGKSGFGYAELSSENDVQMALKLDRRLLAGRPVFISRCERDKSHRSHGFKYSTNIEPKKIFIKGLSYAVENEDLQKLFEEFGKIVDIRIVTNKFGKKKGCAYVEFEEERSAKNAVLKLDQQEFMSKKLTVAISEPPASHEAKIPQNTINSTAINKFLPRTEQKSRISFIPASVQKSNLSSSNQPAMSNEDFRKLISK